MNNRLILKVELSQKINSYTYRLKRIPYIKKFVPENAYENDGFKSKIIFLVRLNKLLSIITNVLFHGLFLFITTRFLNTLSLSAFPFILVLLLPLAMFNDVSHNILRRFNIYISVFKCEPERIYHFSLVDTLLRKLPYAITFYIFFGPKGLLLTFTSLCLTIIYEALLIHDYSLGENSKRKVIIDRLLIALFVFLAVLSYFFNQSTIFYLSFTLITFILSLFAFNIVRQFKDVNGLINVSKETWVTSTDPKQLQLESQKKELRIDNNFDLDASKKTMDSLSGYALLNRIFMMRHRRMWFNPIRRKVLYLLGGFALLVAAILASKVYIPEATHDIAYRFPQFILSSTGTLVFITYFFNVSDKITQAFYLNCDAALLHYAFYRERSVVWKQYLVRFGSLALLNLIPIVILNVLVYTIHSFNIINVFPRTLLLFTLQSIALSIFFSIHYLFLYYIIQPFDKDMNTKSFTYSILNGLVYFIALRGVSLDGIQYIQYIIIAITVLYLFISLYLVYRFSHQTFKSRD